MKRNLKSLGVIGGLLAGCAALASLALALDSPASPSSSVATDLEVARRPLPDVLPLPGPLLRPGLPESQRAIMADGFVDDGEMRAAVAATVACIEAKGLRVDIPKSGDPGERIDRIIRVITAGPESPSVAVFACKAEFLDDVERLFGYQEATRAGLTRDQARAIYDACMAGRGFPVDDPKRGPTDFSTLERWQEVQSTVAGHEAFVACQLKLTQARRGDP